MPRRLIVAAALLVGAVGILVVVGRWHEATAPPRVLVQGGTVASSPPGEDDAAPMSDARFAERYVAELEQTHALALDLVRLGERQSRNLLEIGAAQRRMEDQLAAVEALLTEPPPSALAASVRSYRQGASRIDAAMDDARDGFLRFDWGHVAAARATLAEGTADLERALQNVPSGS